MSQRDTSDVDALAGVLGAVVILGFCLLWALTPLSFKQSAALGLVGMMGVAGLHYKMRQ